MDYLKAFLVGGFICAIGQVLIDKTKLTPARILVAGAALELFGLYKPLVDFAGCGATVPISGFGYTMCKGVREAVAESGFAGILTGGLTASAGGIAAAIITGFFASIIFKSKSKN